MTTDNPAVAPPAPKSRMRVRSIVASSIGNMMEMYDNLIYAYSAVYISAAFFADGESLSSLLATFAVFAVGFLARPVGTLFFGHIGDRIGRRPALIVSVVLMGVATVGVGLLPGYATLGVAAPLLLVVLRLMQGFAVGGEFGGSTAMLVEYAPAGRRGRYGSFNQVSTVAGFFIAAVVVAVNSLLWTREEMFSFCWRIPFLLGVLTMAVALFLRFRLHDTPAFRAEVEAGTVEANPLAVAFRTQKAAMTRGFLLTVGSAVGYYFFLTYLPTLLQRDLEIPQSTVANATLVGLAVMAVAVYASGALSDRIGRKPTLIAGSLSVALLSWPVLALMASGNTAAVYLGYVVIGLIMGLSCGPIPAMLAELFPTTVRYSGKHSAWVVTCG